MTSLFLIIPVVFMVLVVVGGLLKGRAGQAHRSEDQTVERLIARQERIAHAGRRTLHRRRHGRIGHRRLMTLRYPEHAA
ncbi:hypothetical protein [Mongoliimonas terrestris]|uniref:hypothetical protein n=1 Tax=Mongoliimonas terrestris TaxID=1709001 RepID=UPI0011151E92|nr:hypothetical protein [Mongoliimonas terrestris]